MPLRHDQVEQHWPESLVAELAQLGRGAGTVDAGCIEIAADVTDHLRPVVEYNHLKIGLPNQLQRKTAIDSPEHEAVTGPPLG